MIRAALTAPFLLLAVTSCTMTTDQSHGQMMADKPADTKSAGDAMMGQPKTIAEIVAGDANFSTLLTALKAAGLDTVLAGPGPFTVFAPTNDAFAKLPAGTLNDLLKPENKAKLTDILKYHVVSGSVPAATVVTLPKATTLLGKDVTVKVTDGKVALNDTVNVTKTDIKASNGIIHVIDAVLLPPS